MSENNKSYRIRTEVGKDKSLYVKLDQKFDVLEILSLKLRQEGLYKLHTSDYGVIVGRVLANNGFGIPNAKVSVFIQISDDDIRRNEILGLYSYNTTRDKDADGIRYNLLPDAPVNECHKVVGTFPSKTMVLDNDIVLEVYDKYFKFTTKTNDSGDYMIFGVPTGNQTVHVDLDLSDIGLLSQRPRDFVYKGYTIEQFENPNQFKGGTELSALSQIFSQDSMVEVIPFWGDDNEGLVGISRNDVNIQFKFEPTCVFMGSVVSDNSSNGFSKKCVPTNAMGNMDELVTGNGTIEMIRKKPDGSVEEFQIQGNQLIDGNGVWCYQIPMNLDYMKTDEYGNMVPTDNPEEGIPTRARVRFRISMQDFEENVSNYFRTKVLVPHNPETTGEVDYAFGTGTQDSSYRDLFWNNVYSVKSYIPRIQKGRGIRTERFSGIKHCNIHGQNNPIPYNNIRIRLPFMFTVICAIIKAYIWVLRMLNKFLGMIPGLGAWGKKDRDCVYIGDSLCPDLEGWYFAPGCSSEQKSALVWNFKWEYVWKLKWGKILENVKFTMLSNTYNQITSDSITKDQYSIDVTNRDISDEGFCLTNNVDYLIQCIEINLAQEYKVIQFDFYNDWINGLIYIPRWMRFVRKKRKYLFGLIKTKAKVKGCMTDTSMFAKDRYLVDQCSLSYSYEANNGFTKLANSQKTGCANKKQKCHKKHGRNMVKVFGKNGGLVNETKTLKNQNVYYFKPCEWSGTTKINFFATDLCLLGSLNDCDLYGIPQAFRTLNSSSYQLPTNLALTNMEEDGYMYSQGDTGTICASKAGYNANEKVVQADNSFTGARKHNSEYTYSGYDDAVPLTESAGIDWGYTGPGQGVAEFSQSKIYQPGGHFMGLSCSQAETNIKTCINLGRICEHGVGMSQRVLVPRSYDEGTDTWNYTNIMPNGFISQDEIYDHDFRTMFATMNYNNLKTKRDEKTGYLKYDFVPSMPTNFDGTFKKYASGYTTYYNSSSSNRLKVDLGNLAKTSDNEQDEVNHTLVRSLEYTNADYYRFRFGIETTSSTEDKKYFLVKSGSNVSMPVYRNSFYFYFGLKDGATALDEFKKQFFSTCKNDQDNANVLSLSSPSFKVKDKQKSEYIISDFTNGNVVAVVKINGGQMPYTIEFIENGVVVKTLENQNKKSVELPLNTDNLGKYRIRVTDSDENVVTQDYDFTINSIFEMNLTSYDYFVHMDMLRNRDDRKDNCDTYGGYIAWDGVLSMLGQPQTSGFSVSGPGLEQGETSDGMIAFYPSPEGEGDYTIQLTIDGVTEPYPFREFTISEIDNLDFWIGSQKLQYSSVLNGKPFDSETWYNRLNGNDLKWEYRHSFTRQNRNDGLNIETGIIGRTPYMTTEIAGSPEKYSKTDEVTGEVFGEVAPFYKNKSAIGSISDSYEGYDLNLTGIYNKTKPGEKQEYQFIVYDTRGQFGVGKQLATNNTNLTVGEDGAIRGVSNLRTGYRYLVANKNVSYIGYAKGGDVDADNSFYIQIDEVPNLYENRDVIENIPTQVYGFHSFPVYYKPFYFKLYAWSASNYGLKSRNTYGKGYIYNGITYNNKFSEVVCNESDITNQVTITGNSETSDLTNDDRIIEIPSSAVSINNVTYADGNVSFSCTEGHPSYITDDSSLAMCESSITFLFREDIKVKIDEISGMLKVSVTGDSEGVSYYVINANGSDNGGNTNSIGFPCNSSSTDWTWNTSSNLLNPTRNITGTNYQYGDWMTSKSMDLLSSYFEKNLLDSIPTVFRGSNIENVTNKIGDGTTLSLKLGSKISEAYILGVADIDQPDGSSICVYYVYDKFKTISIFNGTYTFGDPEFNAKKVQIELLISVSEDETWEKIEAAKDTGSIKVLINGTVSYTDINVNGETVKGQETLENVEMTYTLDGNFFSEGGVIKCVYNGEYVQYKNFTMKGTTTIKLANTIQTGVDESGTPIITTVEEQFSSPEAWTLVGEQDLKSNEYIWDVSAYAQDNNGKLQITVNLDPYYTQMEGQPKDNLVFNFYVNDNTENPLEMKLNTQKTKTQTYNDINYADVTKLSGKITNTPAYQRYSYDGTVQIS